MLTLVVGMFAIVLVFYASRVLTEPIRRMIAGIREVKRGRLDIKLAVTSKDELGELATDFNLMTDVLRKNKELEATLAQQGKMASLGVLSSGVAHEINNPLGVVLGYAAYLESKMDANDPNFRYIQEIKRESKRCKNIVQDLLSYARVPKPSLEATDINALLEQIVDFAAHHTDLDAVTIVKEFAPELPRIFVDGDQIRQVAINLILNAGAAMPEGGQLVVGTALGEDGLVKLTFKDTGCGIAPENLEKIFEPFFTTKARGTGLGLAITRTIVEQHGGKIAVASEVGKGTTVTVSLLTAREAD
jgi:two-component system NtrC family sensor kinase